MAIQLKTAFVLWVVVATLGVVTACNKKLINQVKNLEKRVGKLESCKPCEFKEGLTALEREIETLKKLIPTPSPPADECQNYKTLSNADRKNTFVSTSGPYSCDKDLGPGWYRFEDAAGSKMADVCPVAYRCGTHATGWLKGGHPTEADGQVTRKACFSWTDCCEWSIDIKVRNCGDFYVYYIDGTPREHPCHLAYCGSD